MRRICHKAHILALVHAWRRLFMPHCIPTGRILRLILEHAIALLKMDAVQASLTRSDLLIKSHKT